MAAICAKCGVELDGDEKLCDKCASLVQASAAGEDGHSFAKTFFLVIVPLVFASGFLVWFLSKQGLLNNPSSVKMPTAKVDRGRSSDKPVSRRVVAEKLEFQLGVDGVSGLLNIDGNQVPVWGNDISIQRPEGDLAVRFAEKVDTARSVARPASQRLDKPLLLKFRIKQRQTECTMSSLGGYMLLFQYKGKKVRLDRLNTADRPLSQEIIGLSCGVYLGGELKAKLKGKTRTDDGMEIEWDLIVDDSIASLE